MVTLAPTHPDNHLPAGYPYIMVSFSPSQFGKLQPPAQSTLGMAVQKISAAAEMLRSDPQDHFLVQIPLLF